MRAPTGGRRILLGLGLLFGAVGLGGCAAGRDGGAPFPGAVCPRQPRGLDPGTGLIRERRVATVPSGPARLVVEGALRQAAEGAEYVPGYVALSYPGGDLPRSRGVCTDVVIRALRHAGVDLQKEIHEDMAARFDLYPKRWGLERPDPNIDHRRVPNQICFLRRHGLSLPTALDPAHRAAWRPGDLVYWKLDDGLDHCGVLADGLNEEGWPLVVHNFGRCAEEDCLARWTVVAHFRYPPPPPRERVARGEGGGGS